MSMAWFEAGYRDAPVVRSIHTGLAVYLAGALLVAVLVAVLDDTWGWTDWYGAVVTGIGLVVVGEILGRRSQELQEGLANLELLEKVGVIRGQAAYLSDWEDPTGSRRPDGQALDVAHRFLTDVRAGLCLFPLAEPHHQEEFLQAVDDGVQVFRASVFRLDCHGAPVLVQPVANVNEALKGCVASDPDVETRRRSIVSTLTEDLAVQRPHAE